MTIDTEYFELMPLEVSIERYTGQDTFGNNTYATAETGVRARPEAPTKTMDVATADGGVVQSAPGDTLRLIIDYVSPGYDERDRVTANGQTYIVTSVVTEWDENGPYYQDLTCANNKER